VTIGKDDVLQRVRILRARMPGPGEHQGGSPLVGRWARSTALAISPYLPLLS
jgi:hypothetical protein